MKKSQVLAGLALAFALGLGVVMPVANTYATVVYPNGATQAQKDDLKADVKAAGEAYAQLDKVVAYTTLYNDVQSLINAMDNKADAMIWFTQNGTYATVDYAMTKAKVNENVDALNDMMSYSDDGLYQQNAQGDYIYIKTNHTISQAQLRPLDNVSESDDINTVLASMQVLLANTKANQQILNDNYNGGSDYQRVETAKNANYRVLKAVEGWLAGFQGNFVFSATPVAYATNDLKVANEDAYKALVNSDEWKDATKDTYTEWYNRYNLFINAAEATPKYGVMEELIEAKANFDKINSNAHAVDYSKALEYVAAFNAAMEAYKSGSTTSTTPSTPSTPDYAVSTITSEDGTVTVTGKFPADTFVKVAKSDKQITAFGNNKYALFDINLVDAQGNKVTVNGTVTVSIKVPADLNGAKSGIYYVTDDGKIEKLNAVYADGVLTYTVSHFSFYAIVEDGGNNLGITAPTTGAIADGENSASTTVAMVAGLATALTAAGAGVVAYRNARRSTRK